jgi:hypothetical protein
MDNTNYFNLVSIVPVDDRVGKPLNAATSMAGIDSLATFRRVYDQREGSVNSLSKRQCYVAASAVVPIESAIELGLGFWMEFNPHQKALRAEERWLARLPTARFLLYLRLVHPIA